MAEFGIGSHVTVYPERSSTKAFQNGTSATIMLTSSDSSESEFEIEISSPESLQISLSRTEGIVISSGVSKQSVPSTHREVQTIKSMKTMKQIKVSDSGLSCQNPAAPENASAAEKTDIAKTEQGVSEEPNTADMTTTPSQAPELGLRAKEKRISDKSTRSRSRSRSRQRHGEKRYSDDSKRSRSRSRSHAKHDRRKRRSRSHSKHGKSRSKSRSKKPVKDGKKRNNASKHHSQLSSGTKKKRKQDKSCGTCEWCCCVIITIFILAFLAFAAFYFFPDLQKYLPEGLRFNRNITTLPANNNGNNIT